VNMRYQLGRVGADSVAPSLTHKLPRWGRTQGHTSVTVHHPPGDLQRLLASGPRDSLMHAGGPASPGALRLIGVPH